MTVTRTELASFISGEILWSATEEKSDLWNPLYRYLDDKAIGEGELVQEPDLIRIKLLILCRMLLEYLENNKDPLLSEVATYIYLKYGEVAE